MGRSIQLATVSAADKVPCECDLHPQMLSMAFGLCRLRVILKRRHPDVKGAGWPGLLG